MLLVSQLERVSFQTTFRKWPQGVDRIFKNSYLNDCYILACARSLVQAALICCIDVEKKHVLLGSQYF